MCDPKICSMQSSYFAIGVGVVPDSEFRYIGNKLRRPSLSELGEDDLESTPHALWAVFTAVPAIVHGDQPSARATLRQRRPSVRADRRYCVCCSQDSSPGCHPSAAAPCSNTTSGTQRCDTEFAVSRKHNRLLRTAKILRHFFRVNAAKQHPQHQQPVHQPPQVAQHAAASFVR